MPKYTALLGQKREGVKLQDRHEQEFGPEKTSEFGKCELKARI